MKIKEAETAKRRLRLAGFDVVSVLSGDEYGIRWAAGKDLHFTVETMPIPWRRQLSRFL